MRVTVIGIFLVLASSVAPGQTAPKPANPTPASGNSKQLIDLGVLTPAQGVPSVCIPKIMKDGALSFMNDQLCPLYLVLSSNQYRLAAKVARKQIVDAMLNNPQVLQQVEKDFKTMSQQEGTGSGTGGSTNLVSKGAASQFLSIASEYGALTESTSGQTTTVAGSLAGIPLVLLKKGAAQACQTRIYGTVGISPICFKPSIIEALSRISYTLGFNTSANNQSVIGTSNTTSTTGTTAPASFKSQSSPSINAITAKWIIVQGKPSPDNLKTAVSQFSQTGVPAKGHALAQYFQLLQANASGFNTWHSRHSTTLVSEYKAHIKSKPQMVAEWKALATEFVSQLGVPSDITPQAAAQNQTLLNAAQFAAIYAETLGQEEAIAATIARPAVLSIEYDDNLPTSQPSNSVFRGIYQNKIGGWTVTANGAVSFYNFQPSATIPGAERFRDFQIAAEADHDFTLTLPVTGKVGMTGSGAFYDQDQTAPAILNVTPGAPVNGVTFVGLPASATQVYASKGNIAIGQLKLTVGSGANLHVPLSVTYSNRTELITSPTWRAQIGVSYDLDSLFQSKQ